jgi:hypothetical protein
MDYTHNACVKPLSHTFFAPMVLYCDSIQNKLVGDASTSNHHNLILVPC